MFPILLANPIAKYATAALAAVLLLVGAYVKGRSDGSALVEAAVERERAAWRIEVAKAQSSHDTKTQEVVEQYDAKVAGYQAEIDKLKKRKLPVKTVDNVVTKEVEKVVTVYVPAKSNCQINKGFVELHNTAAAGLPLSEEQKPDAGEATTKKLSDVGETVAANYYQCNINNARLEALQKIVKDFQAKQKELTK